jgi:hypothetical protein
MPSRQLLCVECASRPPVEEDPGSHVTYVWGTTKIERPNTPIIVHNTDGSEKLIPVPQMLCDACCKPIMKGERACAWTFWRDPQVKYHWEDEYLESITDRKQRDY